MPCFSGKAVLFCTLATGAHVCAYQHVQGSHPKGRNVFLRDMEPFLKWLEEAEEDEDEE